MRHITRLAKPEILIEKEKEWQEKYEAKLDENPHARPDHSRYAHKQINDRLYAMSFGKCFYCETKLSGGNREVDHFVEVAYDHGKAYDWENLYLSCTNCNDKLDANTIPVTDVLDPCRDSDEEIEANISFERELICSVGGSKKGLDTIKKYRLNTDLLDLKRSRWLNKILMDAAKIHSRMVEEGRKIVTDAERQRMLWYMSPEQPYSLMSEVFIKTNLKDLL